MSVIIDGTAGITQPNSVVSGSETVGTTLSVTGATTLTSTSVTGNLTVTANTTTGNLTVSSALNYGGVVLTNAVTGTGKMVLDSSPTIANPTISSFIESVVAVGTVGASSTLSLASGTILTATLTASTPCTFTMPTATAGKSFAIQLTQAASGMTTATFTGVKWPAGTGPTITATASAVDIISFVAIGSVWYGNASQAFA